MRKGLAASAHGRWVDLRHVLAGTICVAVCALVVASPALAADCPNEQLRQQQGVTALPSCMALEQVSPPQKDSQFAEGPDVSSDGGRVSFRSRAALGGTPGLLAGIIGDPYVATRSGSGWTTAFTVPPAGITVGWTGSAQARSFSPDFSSWFQIVGLTRSEFELGVGQAFSRKLGGPFLPLSPLLDPIDGGPHTFLNVAGSGPLGASADHSHLYFRMGEASTAYLLGDPSPAGAGSDRNAYVAARDAGGTPSLALLARDSNGKVWGGNCGARLGGIGDFGVGWRNQGAVSADGSRAYFSTRPSQPETGDCDAVANKLRILERRETPAGPVIAELFGSECDRVAPACDAVDGDDLYQGASVDGTKVYFTSNRQLADSDLDTGAGCSAVTGASEGCDLYLHDAALPAGQRLIQVSGGEVGAGHPVAGAGAEVLNGATAISGDGSHAYFVAEGVLVDDPNPAGNSAAAGQPNLYSFSYDAEHPDGSLAFVGTLDPADNGGLWGGIAGSFLNRAYPVPAVSEGPAGEVAGGDGHRLLFQSRAALTADDGDGTRLDVYRYDADAATLERISKAAPGGADGGPFDVAGREVPLPDLIGTEFAEAGRWASEDGDTVVFKTAEGLLPGDVNGAVDSYLWRSGQLVLLPGTADPDGTLQDVSTLSHDGDTVAFQTFSRLLPEDGDTAKDVYVARTGGGFPPANVPAPCVGAACQGPAGPPPPGVGAISADFAGRGNLKPKRAPRCPKGKRRVKRGGKVRCAKVGKKRGPRERNGSVGGKQGGRK